MRAKIHATIYFIGLMTMAFFMPLSLFVTNASMLMIITNWLIEAGYAKKIHRLIADKSLLAFLLLFIVHLVWLVNTQNFGYAFNDLKIKLPLFVLPIVFATSDTLSKKKIDAVLGVFVLGVIVSSVVGFLSRYGILFLSDMSDPRNMALFISHIRLSIMICFSIFILIKFAKDRIYFKSAKTLWIPLALILWLIFFGMLLQTVTGLACFVAVMIIMLFIEAYHSENRFIKIFLPILASIVIISLATVCYVSVKDFYTPTCENKPLEKTVNGRPYSVVNDELTIENGNKVFINICKEELKKEWDNRSVIPLDSFDLRGQKMYYTVIRYMTSLGLTKDSLGVASLSDEDVKNIENGWSNYHLAQERGMVNRIYVILWELDVYKKTGYCNSHSVSQRLEYRKFGLKLFAENWLCGTGVGDVNDAYQEIYERENSSLFNQNRHRAHDQLLTFMIAFGIFGTLICLFAWLFPIITNWDFKNYYFIVFALIATIAMFSDDMLETSTGAVFVAYFYSLLLWGQKPKND